ncbi:MAG: hypothetical protein LBB43_07300 [Spirochaetaceae bacterium]|nr:hypothetical protein [Spirochaetaceae bacterium]
MNKKLFLVVVVLASVAGGIWAQTDEKTDEVPWGGKKNFVSVDLGILLAGARYERFLTQKISVGANVYWANSFIIFNEFEIGLFARYYLWQGLFGELGLGFHNHSGTEARGDGTDGVFSTTGVSITPTVGWKFDPGNAGGFFVEPGISVPITIGQKSEWMSSEESEVGVSAGFVLFCGLGWAF